MGHSELVHAEMTVPVMTAPMISSRTRRLPYRSPRRPLTGVVIAPVRSVIVTTQDAFVGEVSSSAGSLGTRGMVKVCRTVASKLVTARTATTAEAEREVFIPILRLRVQLVPNSEGSG